MEIQGNDLKFNAGSKLSSDLEINLYETNFRGLDPQIGRFWQIDPMSDAAFNSSVFSYGNNNPITFNDPFGLYSDDPKETSTSDNPKVLEKVIVTGTRRIGLHYLPYLIFPNNRPYSIASKNDWPLSFSRDQTNDLLDSWAMGLGAENRVYSPQHPMTKRLKNAYKVNRARINFYKKYLTDYKSGCSLVGSSYLGADGSFGWQELIMAGGDLVEQFVGSMNIDIRVDEKGENLLFFVSNNTSKTSAFYHAAPSHDRSDGHEAMGNLRQIYVWSEPISASGFDDAKTDLFWESLQKNYRIK